MSNHSKAKPVVEAAAKTVTVVLKAPAPVAFGRNGEDKPVLFQPGDNEGIDSKLWNALKAQDNVKAMGADIYAHAGRL